MKRFEIAIVAATVYLLLYVLLFEMEVPMAVVGAMFVISPVIVLWMAFEILRSKANHIPPLEANEEFGYQDVDKNTLGMF